MAELSKTARASLVRTDKPPVAIAWAWVLGKPGKKRTPDYSLYTADQIAAARSAGLHVVVGKDMLGVR